MNQTSHQMIQKTSLKLSMNTFQILETSLLKNSSKKILSKFFERSKSNFNDMIFANVCWNLQCDSFAIQKKSSGIDTIPLYFLNVASLVITPYLMHLCNVCFKTRLFPEHRPVGRAITRSSLEREVWGSNLGPVKLDTVLPTARHRCDIFSKRAVLSGCNDAEMGLANSLHASS